MKLTRLPKLAIHCGIAAFFGAPSQAITYDYGADFSTSGNPNGDWSYGYRSTLDGALNPFDYSAAHIGQALWWRRLSTVYPAVGFNAGSTSEFDGDSVLLPQTGFMIGGEDYAVVRFTVPEGGQYALSGAWWSTGLFFGPTVDVHVLVNGTEVFGGTVVGLGNASGARSDFALTDLALSSGTTIDFVLGSLNGSIAGDVAAFEVMINGVPTSTPEGGGLGLAVISFAALAFCRRRLEGTRPKAFGESSE